MTETTARTAPDQAGPAGTVQDDEVLTAEEVAGRLNLRTSTVMQYYREGILRPFLSDKKSPRFSWQWVKDDLKKLNRK